MFRSLGNFNYRLWFFGAIISNTGVWMQTTAQSWLVLTELTDGDAFAVGLTIALQYAPPILLVTVTGWATDRFDRRRLLLVTQVLLMLLAAAMGVLVLSGTAELWHVYALSALLGVTAAFDAPARHAMVTDIVGIEHASNAVALNTATFGVARLIGPAVAGITIVAIGTGWVFIANAATFPAMIAAILLMRRAQLVPRTTTTERSRLSDGIRVVGSRADLRVLFTMTFLVGAFALNFPLLAATMAVEFGIDADGFGLMTSALAVGALAGALLSATRAQATMRLIVASTGLYGVAFGLAAVMPAAWSFAIAAALIGVTFTTAQTLANGYVQTTAAPALRGRVIALYLAVLMAGTPIGSLATGWITDAWGPRQALAVAAGAGFVAFAIGALWLQRREGRAPEGLADRA
jgi:MFS family permease